MLATSSGTVDAKEANLCFNAGNLLHQNAYPFYHLASTRIRTALQNTVDDLDSPTRQRAELDASELTLVPFSEMEKRLLLDRAAMPIKLVSADLLATVNQQLAASLGRVELLTAEIRSAQRCWFWHSIRSGANSAPTQSRTICCSGKRKWASLSI